MSSLHHPTAIIEKGARLDENVTVGAYAYIGADVSIGKGSVVHHHATVDGLTTLGQDNEVWSYAYIGGKTHDLKFKGGKPGLKIGNRNVFREYVTIHCGTNDGEYTILGDDNVILAYSHVAHDCVIGNHLVMSSHAALAGHVVVGNHVNVGWSAGTHQFCRLGNFAMVGACSKLVQDVPPMMIADGNPATVRMLNKVGLERHGFSEADVTLAKLCFKVLYKEGLNRSQALERLSAHAQADSEVIQSLIRFAADSTRGWA